MSDIKIQIKQNNGTTWDNLFPKTLAELVVESSIKQFVSDTEKTTWNGKESITNKNQPNGYAGLDENGKITSTQLPSTVVESVAGRTGVVTLTPEDVGLSNVTNESKVTMFVSPSFTGIPIAPTASEGTNTTQLATTAFVNAEVTMRAKITVSSSEPSSPIAEDFWYEIIV
jgi:hypothetical protein